MPDEPKPITSDPDEQELLKDLGIPLTDPNPKADVDETVEATPAKEPETKETPDEPDDKPDQAPADDEEAKPGEPAEAADVAGGGGAAATVAGAGGPGGDEPVPASPDANRGNVRTAEPEPSPAAVRLKAVEAEIEADGFDPYSIEGRKLLIEHNRLAAKVETEPLYAQQRAAEAWKPYTRQFPDIKQEQMEKVFAKHSAAYAKRGFAGDALNAAATVAMEMELTQIANGLKGSTVAKANAANGAKVVPPVAKTPITPKGAIVAPPKATPVTNAAPRVKSDEEELVETMRRIHPAGMRATLRG